ncbi:MAG TPA: LysR family transcriptional regulator [Pseudonocardia sp.]|jgi:DNA-binding transcriptional LysR family regulator
MADPLNLRHLEFFVAAAAAGTMTRTANELHVSQSAVSQAIAELERQLGVQLLIRRRAKGLALTAAGRHLLGEARDLLVRAEDLRAGARDLGQSLSGNLVIGCFQTIAPFVVPQLLEGFEARHPGVSVDYVEGSLSELHELLLDGGCEVAVLYDMDLPPGIDRTVLYGTRPYVLLAPGHPLAGQRDVALAELADHDMVMLDFPPSEHQFSTLLAGAGVVPRVRHRTSSFEMVRSLVARGRGYGLLIQRPVSDTSYEGLPIECRPIRDRLPDTDVVLATPGAAQLSRRAQAFVGYCRESATALADRHDQSSADYQ